MKDKDKISIKEKKIKTEIDEKSVVFFFANTIKNLRKSKEWSLMRLAKNCQTKVITSYISKIENGKQNTSLLTLDKLLKAMDTDIYSVIRSKMYLPEMNVDEEMDFNVEKEMIIEYLDSLTLKELRLLNNIFKNVIEYVRELACELKGAEDDKKKGSKGMSEELKVLKMAGKVNRMDE